LNDKHLIKELCLLIIFRPEQTAGISKTNSKRRSPLERLEKTNNGEKPNWLNLCLTCIKPNYA